MKFTAMIEEVDGLFIGTILELKGCHTQAKDREELITRIEEAIHVYIEDEVSLEVTQVFV